MPGPLEGVKVVELGVWIAGPAAAGVLADWGADVVKVEPPEGDPARQFGRMLGDDLPYNPVFALDNRGKRSVVLDLSTDDGRAAALALTDGADVFVTNLRRGALARLGLDDVTLLARNQRLVYGHITGFGRDGPDADKAAFDIAAFWARAGIAHLLTQPGGRLPFQRGGMGDHNTGSTFAGGICAALYHRERTGQGQLLSSSLYRQGVYTVGFDLNTVLGWGRYPAIGTRETMGSPSVNNYAAGCGRHFWIVGLEGDRHWPPITRLVGHPEWLDDPRFATAADRAAHAGELLVLLDEAFATKPLDEWAPLFDAEPDMFWSRVQDPYEIVNDPTLHAAGGIVDVPDGAGTVSMIATPVDFHGTPWTPRGMAPELGEHTDEVLGEIDARRGGAPTRWVTDTKPGHSQWYIERFRTMAADGADLGGEARLVDAMVAPGARLLDAGCGPGRVGAVLHDRGHTVVGVDADPALIEAAIADHPGPRWLVADLAELDLASLGEPEPFDAAVLAGNVMIFLAPGSETEVLRRVAGHVVPDGFVLVGFRQGVELALDRFDGCVVEAGLVVEQRFATWDLRAWRADADFAVSVLRHA